MASRVPNADSAQTLYFAEIDYGRFGRAFRETELELTKEGLAGLIESGDLDSEIVRVLAVNPAAGTCRDVTADIGALVCQMAVRNGKALDNLTSAARNLYDKAGVTALRELDAV